MARHWHWFGLVWWSATRGRASAVELTLRRFGILEQQPDLALRAVGRHRLLGLLDEALVLAELEQRRLAQLVKLDLLDEHVERNIDGPAQLAARLVVVQNGLEAEPVSVEEVLVVRCVEVSAFG